ncbi:hypothetical protein GWK47_010789 [Chionoecetes opilio]|uniref:Uncharacterized protein n=1 Tax=Chionoecetes opilio TaxID=41210 RepID=A0A8J5CMU0_CHIOP|nr:hypothetical protein GWK47_010789 [Chionoecetes opilio]
MRRRVMRHLFTHLQRVIVKVPRNALITPNGSHAKKAVLCAGHKATMILKNEELRLTMEEERVRSERSTLIKHLASIIGDSTEEIKVKWRNWVRDHMQNPTARQGNTFDMDFDEGSPLPEGSPVAGPSSSPLHLIHPIPVQRPTQKRVFVKRKLSKKGKKLGRPAKVAVNTGQRDPRDRTSSAETVPVPTSILLMAGTSSRGRKIVRKEDINFIT